jgi:RNA-directed DNA polymerase
MSSGSYHPEPVKRVEIPKKSGGTRPLGIPTVGDRIAQMTARLSFEPKVEPEFHEDSYGYRPRRSAHQAVAKARQRCWDYDWVIDLDIKGFFDNLDWELMLKAVDFHKPEAWVRLYIERWLKAPAKDDAGTIYERDSGTPQGGVISPLLANLFLHYAFDKWMERSHGDNPFERYADDIVIHCRTQVEAERLLEEIKRRLAECKLTVHPDKTKIVYCKDRNRKGTYERTEFDFLSFTFRPRTARGKNGKLFLAFTPAISRKSEQAIKDEIKKWKIHRAVTATLEELSALYNGTLRGWFAYFGKFRPSALYGIFCTFQKILVKWAKCKYKHLKRSWKKAAELMKSVADSTKHLFEHWKRGWYANGGV